MLKRRFSELCYRMLLGLIAQMTSVNKNHKVEDRRETARAGDCFDVEGADARSPQFH